MRVWRSPGSPFFISTLFLVLLVYYHGLITTVVLCPVSLSWPSFLSLSWTWESQPSHTGHLHLDFLEACETQNTLDQNHLLSSSKPILTLMFLIPGNSATHQHLSQNPENQPGCLTSLHTLLPFNQSSFLLPTFISKPSPSLYLP